MSRDKNCTWSVIDTGWHRRQVLCDSSFRFEVDVVVISAASMIRNDIYSTANHPITCISVKKTALVPVQ